MNRRTVLSGIASAAVVIGLVVAALLTWGNGPGAMQSAPETKSSVADASGAQTPASSTSSDDPAADEDATVDGTSETPLSDAPSDSAPAGSSKGSSGGGGSSAKGSGPLGVGLPIDIPEDADDLPDTSDVTEVLCTVTEREAIEATAAGLRESILDEADAAKDSLLSQLGLGSLLGGISQAIQDQLDAIDVAAQDELDAVDALVADAVAVCEAGGDPLSVF